MQYNSGTRNDNLTVSDIRKVNKKDQKNNKESKKNNNLIKMVFCSRLVGLLEDFAPAFSAADRVIVTEVLIRCFLFGF